MGFKERIEPLDKLFTLFFLFSPIVVGVATSFGMDLRLLWLPMIMFFIWTLYIYWYRGVYQLSEEQELSLIERVRGLTYFFSFVATFILNSIMVFYPTLEISFLVIILVGFSLEFIELTIPRTFFLKQTVLFNDQQKKILRRVLSLTGIVSIYYSIMMALINLLMYKNVGLFIDLTTLGFLSFFTVIIYTRERQSRKLSVELALSLKETRWMEHYLGQREREERKLKRKNMRRTRR